MELRLEDLVAPDSHAMRDLCSFLSIGSEFVDRPRTVSERVNRWQSTMSQSDQKFVERELGEEIERLGYVGA